jgi:flagellar L-ring protein precursor FlgH
MNKIIVRLACLSLAAFILAGCGMVSMKKYAPEVPIATQPLPPAPPPQEGSLWTGRQSYGLVADSRPLNVGDLVTISITEANKASELANTNTSKNSGITTGINSLFGLSFPMKSFTDNAVNVDTALDVTLGNTSSGQGKTERQSSFTSFLTARVIQVLPNQNLMIQGQRQMRINNETEVIMLTGIIRPQDIDNTNTIASTKVAEARLTVSGAGVVSDKQKVGWLQRIHDHVWPF